MRPRAQGPGPGGNCPGLTSFSSGALSLVVVPDAGMEVEVCALLALQQQQTPLPVHGGEVDGEGSPSAGASGDTTQALSTPGVSIGSNGSHGSPGSQGARRRAMGAWVPTGGAGMELDEDSHDARARERFLWDLGAWLELATKHAAARQAAATGGAAATAAAVQELAAIHGNPHMEFELVQLRRHWRPAQAPAPGSAHASSGRQSWLTGQPGNPTLHAPAPVPATAGPSSSGDPAPGRTLGALLAPGSGASAAPPPALTADSDAPLPPPVPRAALELLGFACSRGWASTSTHIVLGLLDMGHTLRDVNAAVQAAHGWSALHLAAASGSAELVAMTALWRSYAGYSDGVEAVEEWRGMLGAPGPGGLTPLHLAAVLPAPAHAALDLLSSLPAETLSTWFGAAARDGCTPAHYAARAGNAHLNDHALLCLATGCAGLEALDASAAQGLQEVLSLGDLGLMDGPDGESSLGASESVEVDVNGPQGPGFDSLEGVREEGADGSSSSVWASSDM
ncbi:hypothetical protein GPECTOR_261g663 [Gonium pectorale]|uniref:Uncharacterized protein n=1 Tax=Gonium pectorale TaxID=33097 RepID=A0A150FW54_GONPE|nr:hypothetical protein GPECTOR_261g663 [Gonium pectorale]|eukprot:KXZ41853.1 hypothetical protein GPECTOR_261g663 [Gonium pectorale]